jgi:hypothetical protein
VRVAPGDPGRRRETRGAEAQRLKDPLAQLRLERIAACGLDHQAKQDVAGVAVRVARAILLWVGVMTISSGGRVSLVVQGVEQVQARGAPCGEDRREDAGEDRGEREHRERGAGERERDAHVGERLGHERG